MDEFDALAQQFGALNVGEPTGLTEAVDYDALAARFGGAQPALPETDAEGVAGAIARGLAPVGAGAAIGAAIGAPIGGVGAIPGAAAGAAAGGIATLVGDPLVSSINELLGTQYTLPSDAMRDLLTRIGVPEPETEAERIIQAAAGGVGGAGGVLSLGRSIQGSPGEVVSRVGRALADSPGVAVAGGAGGGAAAQTAGEMGAGPLWQLAAGLAGGVASGRAVPGSAPRSPMRGTTENVAEAEALGVPVMTSDVVRPSTFMGKAAQRIGERVPVIGTGPVRASQQLARGQAVKSVLREFGADDAASVSDDIMRDLASKRVADIGRYSAQKNEVIDRLSGAGKVPVPRAMKAIDDEIDKLLARNTEGATEAAERLTQIKFAIRGRNLFQLEAYRRDELDNVFADDAARPLIISARDAGEKALRAIYDPVRKDMGEFIRSSGERRDFNKWMVANRRLQDLAGELNKVALKSVLKSGRATPEDVNKLLFSKKPSDVRQLYLSLSEAGRSNARVSILDRAASKAAYQDETGAVSYSPDKFKDELSRMDDQVGVFFRGADRKKIDGLARALALTRRAGEAGVSTMTGQEAVPFIAGGVLQQLFGSLGASIGAAGSVGAIARVYESAPVRNAIIRLGATAPRSREEAEAFRRLASVVSADPGLIGGASTSAQEALK